MGVVGRLKACVKPEGHEDDSWEELYLAAKERRVAEVAKLRGMYLFSVMKHLQGDMWGRAFRAWAYVTTLPLPLMASRAWPVTTHSSMALDYI